MRYLLLILALILIGVGTYWLLERMTKPRPTAPSASTPSPIETQTPPSLAESTMAVEPPPSPPPKPPPSKVTQPISAYFSLEHLAANSSKGCEVIRHRYYILCYQEADEQASWTAYVLEGKKLQQGNLRRTQDFREDPKVRTGSAELSDYRRSGYDRGHLVPAGDFKWDSVAMSETFYLSNMSPQLHEFNAGIWEAVERTVRAWAKAKGRLVVYTGPILRSDLKKIGRRVSVPDSFYKVVYALEGSRVQAVGFIVPHQSFPKSAVSRFMLPVSDVEKIVGIDFFPELPDPIEVKAERHVQQGFWFSSP